MVKRRVKRQAVCEQVFPWLATAHVHVHVWLGGPRVSSEGTCGWEGPRVSSEDMAWRETRADQRRELLGSFSDGVGEAALGGSRVGEAALGDSCG